MSREELKKSGLLDQYVLGLLSREQAALVERLMQEDPFVADEVGRIQRNLMTYADSQDILPPPKGRSPRAKEDFLALDHELILEMTERNHSLNVWRYGLIATCLLLLGLSGYLFRVKEGYRADLLSEQARHAQDNQSHDRRMSAVEELVIEGDLVPVTDSSAFGRVRVHLPRQGHTALVDISRATPPPPGTAYYLFAGRERDDEPAVPVPHEEFGDLHALLVGQGLAIGGPHHRLPPEVEGFELFSDDAVVHLPGRQPGLDADAEALPEAVAPILEKPPGHFRRAEHVQRVQAVQGQWKYGRKGIPGEVGNEAAPAVDQRDERLKDLVQDAAQLLGSAYPLLHQRFGKGGEAR